MPADFAIIVVDRVDTSDEKLRRRQEVLPPRNGENRRILWDVMKGDAALFMRADQVEPAWRVLIPALEVWAEASPSDFPNYAATWGPENVQSLVGQGQSRPLPTDLAGHCEEKEKNS